MARGPILKPATLIKLRFKGDMTVSKGHQAWEGNKVREEDYDHGPLYICVKLSEKIVLNSTKYIFSDNMIE